MTNKSIVMILAKLLVTVLVFAWLSSRMDWLAVAASIGQLSVVTIFSVIFIILFVNLLVSLRWFVILRSLSVDLGASALLKFSFSALFLNQVIPSGAAGDALRVWNLAKVEAPMKAALSSVILDRVMTLITLMAFVAILQPYLSQQLGELTFISAIWALTVAAILTLIFVFVLSGYLERHFQSAFAQWLFSLLQLLREEYFKKPIHVFLVVLITIVSFSLLGFAVHLLSLDMGLGIPLALCLALTQPVFLVSSIPISVAGWGLREGMMVAAFSYATVDPNQSIAVSICFGLALLLGTIPGAFALLLTGGSESRQARSEASV